MGARKIGRPAPGQVVLDGPSIAVGSPGETDGVLTVAVGLEGALAGWVATWRWALVDDDGQRVHDPDFAGQVRVVQVGPAELSPPGVVELGDAQTSRALRDLRVPFMREAVVIAAKNVADVSAPWARAAAHLEARRPGRRGRSDEFYVALAKRRVAAEEHAPGRAVKYMAEREHVSVQTLHNQLTEARRRGLIDFNPPRLTRRAETILEAMAKQHGLESYSEARN